MKENKMEKKVYSFRLDQDVVEKAYTSGLDLPRYIENILRERLKIKECPTCGAKQQKGKK